MRIFLFITTLLFAGALVYGQSAKQRAQITLHDGSVFKNIVIDSTGIDFYNVKMTNNIRLRIEYNQIRSIEFVEEEPRSKEVNNTRFFSYSENSGIYGSMEMGLTVGKSRDFEPNELTLSVHATGGYQFNKHIALGVGIGLDQYFDFLALPLYVDIRGDILKSAVTPFYYAKIGASEAWFEGYNDFDGEGDSIDGKAFYQPGVGLKFKIGDASLITSLGFKIQKVRAERVNWGTVELEERKMQRLTWTFGAYF